MAIDDIVKGPEWRWWVKPFVNLVASFKLTDEQIEWVAEFVSKYGVKCAR